jgi:tripartite-type tricarboxylate transporter receptor subunit TctC
MVKRFGIFLLACLLGHSTAATQENVSFQGKTVTMIIGYAAGGGTDAFGRLTAGYLASHLPGAPTVVVRNVPGANGMTAMNYVVQQVTPDGYTITVASGTTADPMNYRKPQSHFDPTTFAVVGGAGRGGVMLLINKDAEKRLYDKQARPVVMGALSGVLRSGMQMTAWGIEHLGWNAKWVIGYRGTSELMLALERGEVEMTSTANLAHIQKFLDSGRFKIISQTGALKNGSLVSRPEFVDAPIFAKMLEGRINDPLMAQAFDYWMSNIAMDKWFALPPRSPKAMAEAYRAAYARMIQDPEFVERGKKISEDFVPLLHGDVETLLNTLGGTPPQAIDYISTLLRKQGLEAE